MTNAWRNPVVACSLLAASAASADERTIVPPAEAEAPRVAVTEAASHRVAGPAAEPAEERELAALVGELGHRDESVRRKATARLIATGRAAIAPLSVAAADGSLEVRVRAVTILREIYITGSDDATDAAEVALEVLAGQRSASVASRAGAVLAMNYEVRERRALTEIQKLGAIVEYSDQPIADPVTGEGRLIAHVVLGKDWTGGIDGLKHIKRMERLRLLYYIPESGVTEDALKDLQASVPNLQVQRRGRSCLGVSCLTDPNANGCQVMKIVPGSAAARAGFQLGDVIASFDGKPVKDFDSLIGMIGATKPGDKVKIEVQRDFQRVTLQPVMDDWKKSDPQAEAPIRPTRIPVPATP